MDKARFLVEVHLRTGKPLGQLAREHQVHRSWLYKLRDRYRAEGEAGLEARSRRPKASPARVSHLFEDEIVLLRKQLSEEGFDAGAATIHAHLCRRHPNPPSISTVHRVLRARGFVVYDKDKRPRGSYKRFVADFANECWQADVTHVPFGEGHLEVLNVIDDHSRLCVASRAFVSTRSPDVVRTLHRSADKWGYPQAFLTDNGAIFSQALRGGVGAFEAELMSVGITAKHSRPYHPQTCGKVERFHQTLKKYLAKQDPALTKRQLQGQLDRFVAYYNDIRPHRGIGRHTPAEVFAASEKMCPTEPFIDAPGYKKRHDKVDANGTVTLRYRGRLHHIGVGRAYARWPVVLLIAGREIRVVGLLKLTDIVYTWGPRSTQGDLCDRARAGQECLTPTGHHPPCRGSDRERGQDLPILRNQQDLLLQVVAPLRG